MRPVTDLTSHRIARGKSDETVELLAMKFAQDQFDMRVMVNGVTKGIVELKITHEPEARGCWDLIFLYHYRDEGAFMVAMCKCRHDDSIRPIHERHDVFKAIKAYQEHKPCCVLIHPHLGVQSAEVIPFPSSYQSQTI